MDTLISYAITNDGMVVYHLMGEDGKDYYLNPIEIKEDDEMGHLKYICAHGVVGNGFDKKGRMYLI